MRHFLLTRFNVGILDRKLPFSYNEWMNRRFELFETFTLPSVLNQTNQNFTWVLQLDAYTPHYFVRRLVNLLPENAVITYEDMTDFVKRNYFQWVITTRLDNDDMINPDFVQLIHDNSEEKRMLIDFNGIQEDIINNKKYTDGRVNNNSPFISVIEHKSNFKGVYQAEHTCMPNLFEYQKRIDYIGYIQILHDHNIANKPKGDLCE